MHVTNLFRMLARLGFWLLSTLPHRIFLWLLDSVPLHGTFVSQGWVKPVSNMDLMIMSLKLQIARKPSHWVTATGFGVFFSLYSV